MLKNNKLQQAHLKKEMGIGLTGQEQEMLDKEARQMVLGEESGLESESGKSRLTADEHFADLPPVEVLNKDEENEVEKLRLQEEERLK
jgi:hypothetical protein